MISTIPSETLLAVKDLNLAFTLRRHQSRSLRDVFVDFSRAPIESLLKPRDSLHLLKGVDFSLRRGERLGLLGVNGSGKTSLCRAVAGMLHPSRGTIQLSGECRAIFDTNIGIIPALTGRENARLLARLTFPDETGPDLKRMVLEAMEFSELRTFLDTPFENYSAGMKSRLFLSVTTAKPADLLILDEVYDNTDQFFQRKMVARLQNFIHTSGAVIFVSHSPEHLRKICTRAIVLQAGRVAFDGTVDQALAAYNFLNETGAPNHG